MVNEQLLADELRQMDQLHQSAHSSYTREEYEENKSLSQSKLFVCVDACEYIRITYAAAELL